MKRNPKELERNLICFQFSFTFHSSIKTNKFTINNKTL